MIRQAKRKIVVADSGKLGAVRPALLCPISDINILVTDAHTSSKAVAAFVEFGIEVKQV